MHGPICRPVTVLVLLVLLVATGPWESAAVRAAPPPPATPQRVPVLLDTDIGGYIDDAFALSVLASNPRFELLGVTTVGQQGKARAQIAGRLLEAMGRQDVPVAWGRGPQPEMPLDGQIQYVRHPAVVFGRTKQPVETPAVELLYEMLKRRPREITIVAIGPLTNIAQLLQDHPDCQPWIQRIVFMGGRFYAEEEASQAVPEWNVRWDVSAARRVLQSGVPVAIAPWASAAHQTLTDRPREILLEHGTPICLQLAALYQLSDKPHPTLFDIVAVWYAQKDNPDGTDGSQRHFDIDEKGVTWLRNDGPFNARILSPPENLLPWAIEQIQKKGKPVTIRPPANPAELQAPDRMPQRVHVVENYDTDIESRWWLAGALDVLRARPGGRRCCRSVLTMDFDDLMGDSQAMYQAVVFNPVPGPPMGARTRLRFRYRLKGDYPLRVQLYSLSNGYHRYLTLTGLTNDRWDEATVDLTQMRRHDGSGGPLSADERIDDIQFYTDPRAELWIDDIVLYEAPEDDELRAFPSRIVFTAWFDTGKQGQEWPGDFQIVQHEAPRGWKAARAIEHPETGATWMRIHMRGRRPLPAAVRIRFRYRATGGDWVEVALVDSQSKARYAVTQRDLVQQQWSEATVAVDLPPDGGLKMADEIHLSMPRGAQLLVDDVLVYQPPADP